MKTVGHGESLVDQHAGKIGAVRQAVDLAKETREWWLTRTRWSVTIHSNDRLYDVAHRWFTDLAATSNQVRSLNAVLRRVNDGELVSSIGRQAEPDTLRLYYDETRERKVSVGGHPITVLIDHAEASDADWRQPDTIHFHARTRDGQQAVITKLHELVEGADQRKPALYLLNSWGGWQRRDDLPARSLESVVLAAGQMERIRTDLDAFLTSETEYTRRGLPYHRGYLLYGPSGTGKTSLVRALAATLGLDLWYAPLGDLTKDANLLSLIAEVGPRSILLLEDVDVFHSTRQREDAQTGVSMAGLLNALDGVATPHGLISILTTNDITVIDEALLRPGRVDLREHLGLPDRDQWQRLYRQFFDVESGPFGDGPDYEEGISTAEWTERFKQALQ